MNLKQEMKEHFKEQMQEPEEMKELKEQFKAQILKRTPAIDLLESYYKDEPTVRDTPFDKLLTVPIANDIVMPVVKPTRILRKPWLDEGDVDKFAYMTSRLTIEGVALYNRVENMLQALEADGGVTYKTTGTGIRFLTKDKPLMDLHLWVPTKKPKKTHVEEHVALPTSIAVRIPDAVHVFMGLTSGNSMLNPTVIYSRNATLRTKYPRVLMLPKYPFSTWELREEDGIQQLVIEIHHYTKTTRHAMQAVIYLN